MGTPPKPLTLVPTDDPNRPEDRDVLAAARDDRAVLRDSAAEGRDLRASQRDRAVRTGTDDDDPEFAARFLSAGERDDAAGDRADALCDRKDARRDREQAAAERLQASLTGDHPTTWAGDFQIALEERTVLGQAQGMLMADMGLSASVAFDVLRIEAHNRGMTMNELATEMVAASSRPPAEDD